MGFSRQEYWRGLPCSSPEDLPNSGIELMSLTSPAFSGGFFTTSASWEAHIWLHWVFIASSRLSLVAATGGYSLVALQGHLIAGASLVAEHFRALGCTDSVVSALRLSCPEACGIFLDQGSNSWYKVICGTMSRPTMHSTVKKELSTSNVDMIESGKTKPCLLQFSK